MKKIILFYTVLFAVLFGNQGEETVYAKQTAQSFEAYADIEPRSDNYTWRYQTINGVLYRRLYDIKNHCWVGDWEPC